MVTIDSQLEEELTRIRYSDKTQDEKAKAVVGACLSAGLRQMTEKMREEQRKNEEKRRSDEIGKILERNPYF